MKLSLPSKFLAGFLTAAVLSLAVLGTGKPAFAVAARPEMPRVYVDSAYPDTSAYPQATVPAGGDFQAALDRATCGTVIKLEAGATYTGNFVLRNKGNCKDWIVIQSSALENLPPQGTRVSPAHAGYMPKLTSSAGYGISTEPRANHYRFVGVEISSSYAQRTGIHHQIMYLGVEISTPENIPHHIYFDRTYIHGTPAGNVNNGIVANINDFSVVDSYISEIHTVGFESHAILSYDSQGPMKIVNNFIEASSINILFGGAPSSLPAIIEDVEIRNNYFFKPLSWKIDDPSYAGINWAVKNLFELKQGRRILLEGNIFENNWAHAQTGFAFVIKAAVGDSGPVVTEDIIIRKNIIRNSERGFSAGYEGPLNRILVENNVFEKIGGTLFELTGNSRDVHFNHNTGLHEKLTLAFDGAQAIDAEFSYTNNLSFHNMYGVFGSGQGPGTISLEAYYPGYTFQKNVIIGNYYIPDPQSPLYSPEWFTRNYPPDNYFPSTVEEIKFNHYNSGLGGNYTLLPASPYKNAGTDGKDIGADIPAVLYATRGAMSGVWDSDFSLSPTAQSFGASGGSGTVNVTSFGGGSWNASSDPSWIGVTSGGSGAGNGAVRYSVAANTGSSARTGTMTIAGQAFTVNQDGSSGAAVIAVEPLSFDFGRVRAGETGSQQVKISNRGTSPLTLRGITFVSRMLGIFSHEGACGTLAPGESCNLSVKFTPAYRGVIQGIMKIYSNAGNGKGVQVKVRGTGN